MSVIVSGAMTHRMYFSGRLNRAATRARSAAPLWLKAGKRAVEMLRGMMESRRTISAGAA